MPRHREAVEPWCPYAEIPEELKTLRERRTERRAAKELEECDSEDSDYEDCIAQADEEADEDFWADIEAAKKK